jgi:tetratricopeptide (TPR) repeat protein
LPPIDGLYLDAITSTVRRDFAKAVEHYTAIARQLNAEPYVHVDLGRAYEKNDQTDKAIEQYIAATSRDPLYATAFLRVGVLYGRTGQQDSAMAAFKKAEEIYQAQGKNEGRTEVLLQRGILFNKVGKVAEAREQLQQALAIARTNPNLHQQIQALLQLSSLAVDAGEIPLAQQSAREAVELARNNDLENLTAGGLIDLGSVYLTHGDYAGAEESYKQALDIAQRTKGRGNEARASAMLGSLRLQQRNADEAEHYAQQALRFYDHGGYSKETSQAFLILGRANRLKGDYDAALKAFEQQLALAEQMSDQSLIASSHGEIGAVLEQQERYPEALSHYEQRYLISNSISDQKGKSNALANRAGMFWRLGMYEKALASLSEALTIADKPDGGYKAVVAAVYQYEGELNLSERHFKDAITISQQALTVAGNQYPDVAIRAKRVMGLAQSLLGNHEGRLLCAEALELAEKTKDPRLISTSLLALAEALLLSGNASDALATALRAQESFAHSGQTDSEWRAWLIAARAMRQTGNQIKASEYSSRAGDLLARLNAIWGTNYYKSYLDRPDIEFYHRELRKEFGVVS